MLKELEDVGARLKKQKEDNAHVERQLEAHKSGTLSFLPCGHRKQLSIQDTILIDQLVEVGLAKLTEAERNDERITRSLKSLVFYKIAAKLPDVYRCNIDEKWILGDCGHIVVEKCWEVRELEKSGGKIRCKQPVEKLLPCGHICKTECSNVNTHLVCKEC